MLLSLKTNLAKVVFPNPPSPVMHMILIFCCSLVSTSLDIILRFSSSLPSTDAALTAGNDCISTVVLCVR
uniref:Uncharacterized protein n=1 Tax=Arundo donax TaxID=35708 RepID=A0A0A9HSH0_ARUDO